MADNLKKLTLKEFNISERTGFAFEDSLEMLPEYFKPWNDLASCIVELIENKTARKHIDQLVLLDHRKLSGRAELFLAHLQLSRFVTGYVWENGVDDRAKKIPRCIAVPFYGVSEMLSMPPVITYCDVVLANWKRINPEGNIRSIIKMPGGQDGENFIRHSTTIELAFTPAIQRILDAVYAAEASDSPALTNCLLDVAAVLRKMTAMFSDYHDLVNPENLYKVFLRYTGGYGQGQPLPEGLLFEGVNDEPVAAPSATAGQSSSIKLVDAALSVQHSQDISTAFKTHRMHMPLTHRNFVDVVEQRSQIRNYVTKSQDNALTSAFESCLRNLTDFRSAHIKIVAKYVVAVGTGDPGIDSEFN
ncbi:indoleamine 2,3-dioxygenase 1-like [Ylistrum balloti]|uniref:indoleamine 2,3-dioxygenase 1-like n=1 Tax=Ylistrum balloti TaxID=509963 RepID=UPI002905DA7D|nr:indoleamine 2,3-dioxygenase 1-like [Ylistrum balloti]